MPETNDNLVNICGIFAAKAAIDDKDEMTAVRCALPKVLRMKRHLAQRDGKRVEEPGKVRDFRKAVLQHKHLAHEINALPDQLANAVQR